NSPRNSQQIIRNARKELLDPLSNYRTTPNAAERSRSLVEENDFSVSQPNCETARPNTFDETRDFYRCVGFSDPQAWTVSSAHLAKDSEGGFVWNPQSNFTDFGGAFLYCKQ